MKSLLIKITFFLIMTSLVINQQNSSCHGIDHCTTCHAGLSRIFYVCDECDPQYGIDRKNFSSDLCVFCDSVIPHCVECSSPYITEIWSCGKCADGYKLYIMQSKDDMCLKIEQHDDVLDEVKFLE